MNSAQIRTLTSFRLYQKIKHLMYIFPAYGRLSFQKTVMFGLLLVSMLVSGCASTTVTDPGKRADLWMPPPGKSKVIFIRPGKFTGLIGYINFGVHDEERLIGKLSNWSYFVYECDPGHHVFSTSMENLTFLDADLLPGRIYYVKVEAFVGSWSNETGMSPLYPGGHEIRWKKMPDLLAEVKRSTVTSQEVEHDLKGAQAYTERLKKYQSDPEAYLAKILPEYGQTTPIFSP